MKIDKLSQSTRVELLKGLSKNKTGKPGASFQAILEEAKTSHLPGKTGIISHGAGIESISSVVKVPLTDNVPESITLAEDMLTRLEKFSEILSEPSTSTQELRKVVNEINKHAKDLASKSELLPANSSLREILDQLVIISAKEVEKFNRGDYAL